MDPLLEMLQLFERLDELKKAQAEEYEITQPQGIAALLMDHEDEEEVQDIYALIGQMRANLKKGLERKESGPKHHGERKSALLPITKRLDKIHEQVDLFKKKDRQSMICFIMYDIVDNKARKNISKALEEKGLVRVQKSIFMGEVQRSTYDELDGLLWGLQEEYDDEDSIFIVPVAESAIRSMKVIGQGFDANFILNRGNTLFF
ncbi:MAG: CRISPR-associated endonuclease Cas2 [Bacteroidia bacterium]|nr:CRISPR-associated endonuclease Cas2 [Bacteroidia bacterium]